MPSSLEQVTKDAMELSPAQKLKLVQLLLESVEAEATWDAEIRDRIRAIDEGRVVGVGYEEVMRVAEQSLAR